MGFVKIIIGAIVLLLMLTCKFVGYSGSGETEVSVPSCTSEIVVENHPFELNVCDKAGMTDEDVPIPSVIDFVIEATLRVNWDAQYGWIGVVESSESDKCETLDGVLVCDTEDLDFVTGGPESDGEFGWMISGGEYRFTAGSTVEGTDAETSIEYRYNAVISNELAIVLSIIGGLLVYWGLKSSRD